MILVEPMTFPKPPPPAEGEQRLDLAAGAVSRRDKWPSRQEAFDALRSRSSFKMWDPRVLKIFTVIDKLFADLFPFVDFENLSSIGAWNA